MRDVIIVIEFCCWITAIGVSVVLALALAALANEFRRHDE